jgi:hypothetical protein
MTEHQWRNVVSCMQERAFDNLPEDEDTEEYINCVETLCAAYTLMDLY